jgi:hypothetical protein
MWYVEAVGVPAIDAQILIVTVFAPVTIGGGTKKPSPGYVVGVAITKSPTTAPVATTVASVAHCPAISGSPPIELLIP